jgi:WD40 repeat protein
MGDSTIKIWDAQTAACLLKLEGHNLTISSVAAFSDDRHIVSASTDGTGKIWDAQNGACLHTLQGCIRDLFSVDVSPDGRKIILGSDDRQ